MTDNSSDTTAVMPPTEPPVAVEETPAVPGQQYQPAVPAGSGKQGTPKTMVIIAAVVLGLLVLGSTFASGVVVGSHVASRRAGAFAGAPGELRGPGAGMNGRSSRDGSMGGGMQGRGGRSRGGAGRGQGGPRGQLAPQGQNAPQDALPPQGQAAPTAPDGQSQ